MKTIELFWLALEWNNYNYTALSKKALQCGYIIDEKCSTKEVYNFLNKIDINVQSTFYKTFQEVLDKSRFELFIDQVKHYASTYGTNHTWTPYIPNDWEKLETDFKKYKVIKVATKEEILARCDKMLASWIALEQKTIDDLFEIYDYFIYLPDIDIVKNKEAKMLICKQRGLKPKNPVELLRFLVYLATESTLLIKNKQVIAETCASKVNLTELLSEVEILRLSSIFLRFKPLMLAFKKTDKGNARIVNYIRRLAVKNHKPYEYWYFENILNDFSKIDELPKRLEELNNFKKIALIEAINVRLTWNEYSMYTVRNGKFFLKEKKNKAQEIGSLNLIKWVIYQSLINSLSEHKGKTFYIPKCLDIKLPKSEKTFIGNLPMWSEIILPEDDLIIWINWRGKDGAQDFDLSFTNIDWSKIGWNSGFKNKEGDIVFSWDMTSANPEATELFYFWDKKTPWLIKNNRYCGNEGALFTFFVAKENIKGSVKKNYMVKKENILFQTQLISESKEQILWVRKDNSFIIQNIKSWNKQVSTGDSVSTAYLKYMAANQKSLLPLRQVLIDAGLVEVIEKEDAVIDFDYSDIKKDDIISLLS